MQFFITKFTGNILKQKLNPIESKIKIILKTITFAFNGHTFKPERKRVSSLFQSALLWNNIDKKINNNNNRQFQACFTPRH